MLGIQVNGEFLELNPGTQLELYQDNPFLQLGDELRGDVSLPFEVKCTPKNMRLLQHAGLLQKRIDTAGVEAVLFDNGVQHSTGRLKVEKPSVHLNMVDKGSISLYYVSGVSSFYQDIKDVNLRQLNMGGSRVFGWDNFSNTGAGFWGHATDVLNGRVVDDYVYFPVWNEDFAQDVQVMNKIKQVGSELRFEMYSDNLAQSVGNALVPFIKLPYLLKRIEAFCGWRFEGSILSDADFLKIVLVNFRAIEWHWMERRSGGADIIHPYFTPAFDLADHLPDISLSEWLINLKNRFGWWFDFDRRNKVIRIRRLMEVAVTTIKDFTAKASPLLVKTVAQNQKIYALRNNSSTEYGGGNFDLSKVDYRGAVNQLSDLPTAVPALFGQVYLLRQHNNFYQCRQNTLAPYAWQWMPWAYNTADYEPPGANEEVTTSCTTIGNEDTQWNMFIPHINYSGIFPPWAEGGDGWNTILLFYHGICNNRSGGKYPFASSGIYDMNSNQVAQWSLAFECQRYDGVDVGLAALQWKPVLALLSGNEEVECTLNLDAVEYLNLQFSNVIAIQNVRLYIKQIKAVIPYKSRLAVVGVRI